MLHPALPTLGFLAAVLALIPLPRQIQARYIPTIATSLWLFGSCVIQSVNVIVWAGNTNNPIPVWCDISESTNVSHCCHILIHSSIKILDCCGGGTTCRIPMYLQASRTCFVRASYYRSIPPNIRSDHVFHNTLSLDIRGYVT